jgi:hypothetical protein
LDASEAMPIDGPLVSAFGPFAALESGSPRNAVESGAEVFRTVERHVGHVAKLVDEFVLKTGVRFFAGRLLLPEVRPVIGR